MARSTSPRRRKRLPRAKWSSVVSGSSFATSMKASMARSGSSFRRKFSPLKYESGRLRLSDSICRKSKRAATHPRPNSTGTIMSHQGSKFTRTCVSQGSQRSRRLGNHGLGHDPCLRQGVLGPRELAPQAIDLAPALEHGGGSHQQAEGQSQDESGQHHHNERHLLNHVAAKEAHVHRRRVPQGKQQHDDKNHQPQYPDQVAHSSSSEWESRHCTVKNRPVRRQKEPALAGRSV